MILRFGNFVDFLYISILISDYVATRSTKTDSSEEKAFQLVKFDFGNTKISCATLKFLLPMVFQISVISSEVPVPVASLVAVAVEIRLYRRFWCRCRSGSAGDLRADHSLVAT